jgi:hypothetical protein
MAKKKKIKSPITLLTPEKFIRTRSRSIPIFKCYVQKNWEKLKFTEVIIIRKHTNGNFTIGAFFVDLKCTGVKKCLHYFNLLPVYYDDFCKNVITNDYIEVKYELAHNIIFAGYEYAQELGIPQATNFDSIMIYFLEEDNENIELIDIECGLDNMPWLMETDMDTTKKIKEYIQILDNGIGKGNYLYANSINEINEFYKSKTEDVDSQISNNKKTNFADLEDKEETNFKNYTLKIELLGIEPTIWRTFVINSGWDLEDLHNVIQDVMGWERSHLYCFKDKNTIYDSEYGINQRNDLSFGKSSKKLVSVNDVTIQDVLKRKGSNIEYEYDFGDSWMHKITVINTDKEDEKFPMIIDGERACPPEDCGGIWGYYNLVDVLNNPKHPDYEEMKEWYEEFDPNKFDIEQIKKEMI